MVDKEDYKNPSVWLSFGVTMYIGSVLMKRPGILRVMGSAMIYCSSWNLTLMTVMLFVKIVELLKSKDVSNE